MRIVAGRFKGRALKAPPDARLRPTSDKVRQAVFNILEHRDLTDGFALENARVVDLFAGTGALGLEALSRGARYCLFIDDAAESRALIRDNVEALNLTGASKIWRRDAAKLGPLDTLAPFDLAFLDPPYRKGLLAPALLCPRARQMPTRCNCPEDCSGLRWLAARPCSMRKPLNSTPPRVRSAYS